MDLVPFQMVDCQRRLLGDLIGCLAGRRHDAPSWAVPAWTIHTLSHQKAWGPGLLVLVTLPPLASMTLLSVYST